MTAISDLRVSADQQARAHSGNIFRRTPCVVMAGCTSLTIRKLLYRQMQRPLGTLQRSIGQEAYRVLREVVPLIPLPD